MEQAIIYKIKAAPKEPGCYIFYSGKNSLYVGKAANLRNRLKSYLSAKGRPASGWKIESLHKEATKLDYIVLRSEIEALIEESRLIKELKPKYNVLWRDDKSYLYVAFTREKFPKIFITHAFIHATRYTLKPALIGPFTDSSALRLVMKLLRRYFPYCTCMRLHLRDCLNSQIGRCLDFCCKKYNTNVTNLYANDTNRSQYARGIRMIKMILRGQSKKLLKTLKDEKEKEALEKILQHREFLAQSKMDSVNNRAISEPLAHSTLNISRVECYDISNFVGKEAVGAMTVLVKSEMLNGTWVADKSQWRKFKIKFAPTRDDPRMIAEVVSRRLNHPEWPYPDLIIIDGGLTQCRAAIKALEAIRNSWHSDEFVDLDRVKIISFAKPQQKIIGMDNPSPELQKLVEQAIYQTHNFVIRYHRQVRAKAFLKQ